MILEKELFNAKIQIKNGILTLIPNFKWLSQYENQTESNKKNLINICKEHYIDTNNIIIKFDDEPDRKFPLDIILATKENYNYWVETNESKKNKALNKNKQYYFIKIIDKKYINKKEN
jgi:hypothetical protein